MTVRGQTDLIKTAQNLSHRGKFVALPIDPDQLRTVRVIEPDQVPTGRGGLDGPGRPEVWDVRRNWNRPLRREVARPRIETASDEVAASDI